MPMIIGILRDKTLVALELLFKNGFLDFKNLNQQKFDLKYASLENLIFQFTRNRKVVA